MSEEVWEEMNEKGNQCNSSQPKQWSYSQHPKSTDSRANLEEIKRYLYEKEFDKQVVREEATL